MHWKNEAGVAKGANEDVDDGLAIGPARIEDAPAVLAIQKAAFLQEARRYDDPGLPPLLEPLESVVAAIRDDVVLTARHMGRIVGVVRGELADGTCLVGRLAVEPGMRGRGIGSRLMAALEARLPDVSRFSLFTGHKSLPAIRLYRRLGYEACAAVPVNDRLTLIHLEKIRGACARSVGNPCTSPSRRPRSSRDR